MQDDNSVHESNLKREFCYSSRNANLTKTKLRLKKILQRFCFIFFLSKLGVREEKKPSIIVHSAGNETGCRFRFQKQNLRYGNGTATVGRYGAVPGRSVGRSFKWEAAAWHSAQEYMSTRTDADDFDVSQRRSASSPLRFVQNPTSDHRSRSVATSMTTSGPDCCCCCY